MPELTPKERLQPSLLDRLIDDEPQKTVEPRIKRIFSMAKLRQAVLRDLSWLFNTTFLEAVQPLDDYPRVAESVVNYGLPELAGRTMSDADVARFETAIRDAICRFEPRILPNTVKINVHMSTDQMNLNALSFDIEGELWGQPAPEHLLLRSLVDLESGDVKVANLV